MWFYNKVVNIRSKLILLFYKIIYMERLCIDSGVYVRKGFYINMTENSKIKIGVNTFFNNNCSINSRRNIEIGSECLFGENVKIYDHNHVYKNINEEIRNQGFSTGTVIIGDNCWIGSNVVILKDVVIGDNCIIGANCLIYKSIPSNTVVKAESKYIINERVN